MNNASEPAFHTQALQGQALQGQKLQGQAFPDGAPGVLKAMSPGVVDFLFRQLVAGESAEDFQWHREGMALSAQTPGAELARRLAETDLEALTPTELFHYVRAAQRLSAWAESLREHAVGRYCATPSADASPPR
ncbi:hypothetical protein ACQCSU_18925 [Pseudarthrobacter sp. O4]|uniref:hypothetical protein n=1 Tax=Pseudarthrobacter sp. O4 TaxID=3418417 RepID=UPI003CF763E1